MTTFRWLLRRPFYLVSTIILAWVIAVFLVQPNLTLLQTVFSGQGGGVSLRSLDRLLGSERVQQALLNSLMLAVALAVTANVVGIFIVLATRFYRVKGARILWIGYASTLVSGGIVLVFGYLQVFGNHGIVTRFLQAFNLGLDPNWFSGFAGILIVMTLTATGNHLIFLTAALSKVDYQMVEAARVMGASEVTILRRIVLPALRPMIFALTVLTFLGGLGALAAPQILGGRDFPTITPLILSFAQRTSSRDLAATLAILLGIATIILLFVLNRVEKGGVYFSVSKVPATVARQRISNRWANGAFHVAAWTLFLIYISPIVMIVVYSFTDAKTINSGEFSSDSFTIDNYITALTTASGLKPLLVSVVYSSLAALAVIVVMMVAARLVRVRTGWLANALEYLLHIPWVLPSTMIALGLIVTFDHSQPGVGGAILTGTPVILLLAYIVVKLPFTFRLLKASFASVPDSMEEAAQILGAGQLRTFVQVVAPVVLPTALAITALNITSLLDEYDLAVFLSHPSYQPLGMALKSATAGEGISDTTALAYVYAVLLMAVSAVVLWAVYGGGARSKKRRRTGGEAPSKRAKGSEPDPGDAGGANDSFRAAGSREPEFVA